MSIFSAQEISRRHDLVRARMAENELDAVIATSYPGSYYLSGAPIHAFGRPMATLLPLEGEPGFVTSIMETDHVRVQSPIADVRHYWDFGPTPDADPPIPPLSGLLHHLKAAVTERGLASGRIGFEESTLPVGHLAALEAALPDVTFLGASDILASVRRLLSAEELALVRAADEVADIGLECFMAELAVARPARDLAEATRQAMETAILEHHPDMPFVIHVGTGLEDETRSAGHSEWTTWASGASAEPGQILEVVESVFLWGYWGNVERTVALGEPSGEARRAFEVMVEANEAAIAAIRPGMALAEVDRICKAVLRRNGYPTRAGTGCGRGIVSYEGNARELAMDVRSYSDVILEAGMVFSLEPDLQAEGALFRHCNTIIVTATGCEVDSRLPRGVLWV